MRSSTDYVGQESGREWSLVVELPRWTSWNTRSDPKVVDRMERRGFTAQYKLGILEEADAYRVPSYVERGCIRRNCPRGVIATRL